MSPKERLSELVTRFAQLQESLRLSDRRFATRFRPYLRSEKQWTALRKNTWDGYLNLERTLINLERMAASLDGGAPVLSFYDSLPFAREMDARLDDLLGTESDRRCVIVLATTGCGKTVWARRRSQDEPDALLYCRARPTWRENLFAIASGLAAAIGCPPEKSPRAQLDTLIDALRGGKQRTLLIDEAHDGGVALMKLAKTLIDETGTRFVYLAYPTEFDRVRGANEGALAEAKQLLGRTLKPIFDRYRSGLGAADIVEYLRAAAGLQKDGRTVAEEMLPLVRANGNLRVLEDAIESARIEVGDKDLTARAVHDALCDLCRQVRPEPQQDKGQS